MKHGTIHPDDETDKSPTRRYYLIFDGLSVAYIEGEAVAYHLDKMTGEWIEDAFTWRHISGIGGDSNCEEVSERQAQEWVAENLAKLKVNWS
ncbi:hypothetical protein [Lentisalinibacter sediminis]|uniref:hypothetical protein n=1 Tax=Lentisalinibacter sediminis TaxID=2992237 RepID=UPI00386B7DAD